MLNQKYAEASVEVLDILNHMNISDVTKVSKKFITFLKENASANYIPKLDYSKKLKEMDLRNETKGLLALMYEKYWCSEDEKKKLLEKYSVNEQQYQKELKEKYNSENLFNKDNEHQQGEKAGNMLMVVKKENIFMRFINKIKSLFIKQ